MDQAHARRNRNEPPAAQHVRTAWLLLGDQLAVQPQVVTQHQGRRLAGQERVGAGLDGEPGVAQGMQLAARPGVCLQHHDFDVRALRQGAPQVVGRGQSGNPSADNDHAALTGAGIA